jgi:GNAT superfamily N-acetyltransferase
MKRKNIPMSFAEYEVLAYPFGWKAEYWDGQARLTPREMGVTTRLELSPRPLNQQTTLQHHTLVQAYPTYTDQMIVEYFEVFAGSVEFCDWPAGEIQKSAERDIRHYFEGKRGDPLPASVIALETNTRQLDGVALFVLKANQRPFLELLYVRSPCQRQGLATAMVSRGINHLIETNFHELVSTYHICNCQSRQWHHKIGFQDVYDIYYIKLKLGWLNHEIFRRQKLGVLIGLEALIQEREDWQSRLELNDWPKD